MYKELLEKFGLTIGEGFTYKGKENPNGMIEVEI